LKRFALRLIGPLCALTFLLSACCLGQESVHIDGLCLFDSDHFDESLYVFPPDKQALNMFQEMLAKSGKDLHVVVKAANVPEVAAAENGNERLLLYNQFVLDRFQKEGRQDWRLSMLIAHQIGHHASNHSLTLEPRMRVEIELEADRFGGYLLYQLGATLGNIEGLEEFFQNTHQSAAFPDAHARFKAAIEGWHDGRAEQGGGQGFDPGDDNIPKFPSWPPPQASANMDIPRDLLLKNISRPLVMDAATRLLSALDQAGYGERSFYAVPGGFALVSRIEHIYPDGRPKEGDERWPLTTQPPRIFSLSSYIRALLTSDPGFYRVIAFVVTSRPLVQSGAFTKYSSPRDWVWAGANRLPTTIAFLGYTNEVSCTALIYEFQQVSRNADAILHVPGSLTGRTHLERSSLLGALNK
jgi:hypothetical protein